VRPYQVVDSGFPGEEAGGALIKPYPGGLHQEYAFRRHFNFKHSSTRMPVEHVNGVLKKRWRILFCGCEIWCVRKMTDIILVCCILHNLCLDDRDVRLDDDWREGDEEVAPANHGMDVDAGGEEETDAAGMFAVMLAIGNLTHC